MKFIKHLSFLFIILSSGHLYGQNRPYARKVIDTLASPAFHGRGYVFSGDSLASEFIKGEFKAIGLQPVQGKYFQSFQHAVNAFPGQMSLVLGDQELRPGAQYLADPASASGKGNYKTLLLTHQEIIEDQWIRTVKKSKNKVLLVDLRSRKDLSAEETKKSGEFSAFLKYSKNIPASGLAFLHEGKIPWYISSAQAARPSFFIFMDSIEAPQPGRISFKIEAKYLENYTSKNVVGFLPGASGGDSCLVITAHYDHLGRMGKGTYFPGAHDNASGVALLLDLAKKFKAQPPRYDMYFIAFAGEEAGLTGSRYFTEHPLFPLESIKFLLNLDLAGTGVDGITAVNGKIYDGYFNRLKTINEEMNLMKTVKARGEACNSDHCFFHQKGVPSFFIYTLGGTMYYHDIFDKAETLSLNEYDEYFKLLYHFLSGI